MDGAMSHTEEISQSTTGEHVVVTDSVSRRRFLSFAAGTLVTITSVGMLAPLAGMFLAPLFKLRKEQWLTLGQLDEADLNEPTKFVYRYAQVDGWFEKTVRGTVYVVRNGADVVVLSNLCSHLGCGVRWDPGKKQFLCPCHNGFFDRNGKVVSGPPPDPLEQFTSRIVRGKIQIKIEEA